MSVRSLINQEISIAAHVEVVVVGCEDVGRRTLIQTLSQNSLRPLEVARNSPKANSGSISSLFTPNASERSLHSGYKYGPSINYQQNIIISVINSRSELSHLSFRFTTDVK